MRYSKRKRTQQTDSGPAVVRGAGRSEENACLLKSGSTFRDWFSASRHGIVLFDDAGCCVDANPAAEAIIGLSVDQLRGRNIPDFMQPGLNLFEIRDISKLKRVETVLRESEDRHRRLLDKAQDAILIHQGEQIVYCNSAALQLYGASSADHLQVRPPFEFVHPDERELARTRINRVLQDGDVFSRQCRHLRMDGLEVPVEITAAAVIWQRSPAVQLIIRDVSERKQTELALREGEQLLARAQQISHLGSWELDLIKNKLTWSDEVFRIFGLQPQEFAATYEAFLERVHPEDRAAVDGAYSGSIQQGKDTYEIVHRIVRATTGEIRYVLEKCEHVRNADGTIIRSIGMVLDVTERKEAEAQKDLHASILRVLNRDSIGTPESIREVVSAIRKWSGFDAVGLRLRKGEDCPYFEQNGFSDDFLREENFLCAKRGDGSIIRNGEGCPILECTCGLVLSGRTDPTLPFFTGSGSFWTNRAADLLSLPIESDPRTSPRNNCIHRGYQSVAIIPVRAGQDILGLLQLNDKRENRLTADLMSFLEGLGDQLGIAFRRTQAQEELRLLNESLERQVNERTAVAEQRSEQLRLLASELTMAEDRERQRLAQVLHDGLQQFLAGAKFRLATIEQSTTKKSDIAEIASILDEAIETSRSLTAELSPPILHQSGLVAGLNWLARWMHDKHGADVQLLIQPDVCLPPENISVFLFQAVKELLFNTIKHSGVDSARVAVSSLGGEILVKVEDNGKGFDQTKTRTEGGTSGGFGLFRINERISMLGGKMLIESAPGTGTRITLTVPEGDVAVETAELSAGIPGQIPPIKSGGFQGQKRGTKTRVLLVDDHAVMRHGLAVMLQEDPSIDIVGEASDGEAAVTLVRKLKPGVVLMDISMPGMNGIEATRIIHSEFPEIRVIGLSMFQEGEQAAAMREAGAVNYLSKSGPPEEVLAAIRYCVNARKDQTD
jgi:PAS domain S-box-containing protein